jgi:LysR family glycine cleavage system transcriptional activator
MNRLPPLTALKSFSAAARLGSFRAASAELFVTPSAVSHQVKSLEEFLGVELFVRRTRRISLTAAGEEYYQSVQEALYEIDRATQKLISTHQAGQLHLSLAPAFLTRWLLPRIGSFYEAQPDIQIEMSATSGLIDFDKDETDMAVYFGGGQWDGIEVQLLRDFQQVPVCNPALLNSNEIYTPSDILNYPLLHIPKRKDEWQRWFAQVGVACKEKKRGLYLSSGALTTSAAINGLGFALADIGFVSEEVSTGKLIAPLDDFLLSDKSFYLVHQKKRALTYPMKAFQSWVMDEMIKDIAARKEEKNKAVL